MEKKATDTLRQHILGLLDAEEAHAHPEDALADFPVRLRGTRCGGCPHTAWQLLEHLRLAQWDILHYTTDPHHRSPQGEEGYWPEGDTPPDGKAWDRSVAWFLRDLRTMKDLVADGSRDPLAPLPHDPEATILGQACILANHNSYHIGQLVMLRRALGAWHG